MPKASSKDFELPEFTLYDYYPDDKPIPDVKKRIDAGMLPTDALFRVASIGCNQTDPDDPKTLLQWNILNDIASTVSKDDLNPVSYELMFSEPPTAVIDFWGKYNKAFYASMDAMYYTFSDLVSVIKDKRHDEGTSLPKERFDDPMNNNERARCRGLTRPLWRTLVNRVHPEWLSNPQDYYPPTISFNNVYYVSDATARRRVVGGAVLRDDIVLTIYQETLGTGVKGIGPSGKESLRRLLAEEHPELY